MYTTLGALCLLVLPSTFPVSVRVDADKSSGPLKPIWRFFGADEPNYAYMKDGQKLLSELGRLRPGSVYFRAHNLLTTGDGTPALKWGSTNAYREDTQGRPIDDWTIVDRIFDAYLERGVKPYVEIGFMPRELSQHPDPYQHRWTPTARYNEIFTGWAYPPKDEKKWADLVYRWVRHCLDRYGRNEVETWYWETWNEANIGYWRGTPEEFRNLHDLTVDAVRRALPTARVGGPDCAGSGGRWTRDFLEHCLRGTNHATGRVGTPIDFISFHAKGAPSVVDGHVRMGIATHLRTIRDGFEIVASYPELKARPIVIGESDPEGCAACQGPRFGYRNGTMYSSYTAASFARIHDLADQTGVNIEGALTWAFEFEGEPPFAGFRALATSGIDLPVLNVFRMFSLMGSRRVKAESSGQVGLEKILEEGVRARPDVGALASTDGDRLSVLLWHYHDDDLDGPAAEIDLEIRGLPADTGPVLVHHYRVDHQHGNAFEVWKRMGSPASLSREQTDELTRASRLPLVESPGRVRPGAGVLKLRTTLPRQAVSLIRLECPTRSGHS